MLEFQRMLTSVFFSIASFMSHCHPSIHLASLAPFVGSPIAPSLNQTKLPFHSFAVFKSVCRIMCCNFCTLTLRQTVWLCQSYVYFLLFMSQIFWLLHRKVMIPFLIMPTLLWVAWLLFQCWEQPSVSKTPDLLKLLKRLDVDGDSEAKGDLNLPACYGYALRCPFS